MLMSVLHLQGGAGISITGLADYLEVTGPHVTGVIGKLAARGFVRKADQSEGPARRAWCVSPRWAASACSRTSTSSPASTIGCSRASAATNTAAVGNFHARFIRNTKATLDWIGQQAGGPEQSRVIEF